MKLVLEDDKGNILQEWSIAFEYDYDPEDLDAYGEHDFYLFVDEHLKDQPETYGIEIGEEVIREIMMHTGRRF